MCMKDIISPMAKEVCKSNMLKQYIHTLVNAYWKYDNNRHIDKENADFWRGMEQATLATINDLGFGHLIFGKE